MHCGEPDSASSMPGQGPTRTPRPTTGVDLQELQTLFAIQPNRPRDGHHEIVQKMTLVTNGRVMGGTNDHLALASPERRRMRDKSLSGPSLSGPMYPSPQDDTDGLVDPDIPHTYTRASPFPSRLSLTFAHCTEAGIPIRAGTNSYRHESSLVSIRESELASAGGAQLRRWCS